MTTTSELIFKFSRASGEDRAELLFGAEVDADAERISFLLSVAQDSREYDLARIEAIKAVGLAGAATSNFRNEVVETLIDLAQHDADDDVRAYALQALAWHALDEDELERIADLVLDQDEDELIRENAFGAVVAQQVAAKRSAVLKELLDDPVFGKSAKRELDG